MTASNRHEMDDKGYSPLSSRSGWRDGLSKVLNGSGFIVLSTSILLEAGLREIGIVLLILCMAEISSSIPIILSCWCRANVENKYSSKASNFDFILLWIMALLIVFVMLSNSWSLIAGFRDCDFSILIYVLITVLLVYIKINGRFITNFLYCILIKPRFMIYALLATPLPLGSRFYIEQASVKMTAGVLLIAALTFLMRKSYLRDAKTEKTPDVQKTEKCVDPILYICRNVDLLIIAFIFEIEEVAIYLVARGLAFSIVLGLSSFGRILIGAPRYSNKNNVKYSIDALAARLNLAIFFIGSGVAMGVLAAGKLISPLFEAHQKVFLVVIFWSVARYSAKALFGTYEDILALKGMDALALTLNLCFLTGVFLYWYLFPLQSVERFAMVIAFGQLMHAALSASIVAARCGIWPGPTAIFFRQIKLL